MKVFNMPQGSLEWHMARAGVITASNFHLLRRTAKLKTGPNAGDYNDKAKNYAFRVAVERISKMPIGEEFAMWQGQRGQQLEPEARREHELRHEVLIEELGFITTDDGKFGASPDGKIVGTRMGAEYKCFTSPEKIRDITLYGDYSEVVDQCDGGMWLTGDEAWHFGLYCPALKPLRLDFQLIVIERDDDRINELEEDLIEFERLVTHYEMALRARAAGDELPPWEPVAAPAPRRAPAPAPMSLADVFTTLLAAAPAPPAAAAIVDDCFA